MPYVIEPLAWGAKTLAEGESLQFDMVLVGRALKELSLVVEAWKRAAVRGLGGEKMQGTATLERVDLTGGEARQIYASDWKRLEIDIPPFVCPPFSTDCQALTLRFTTPLRLQDNGRALPPVRLTPAVLLMAAVRRAALICECYGTGTPDWDFKRLAEQATGIKGEKKLHWQDWTRYSSRQKRTMQLGGVLGEWRFSGQLAPFLPALYLCQWLHVGKETAFGLGHYDYITEKTDQVLS